MLRRFWMGTLSSGWSDSGSPFSPQRSGKREVLPNIIAPPSSNSSGVFCVLPFPQELLASRANQRVPVLESDQCARGVVRSGSCTNKSRNACQAHTMRCCLPVLPLKCQYLARIQTQDISIAMSGCQDSHVSMVQFNMQGRSCSG